MLTAAENKDFTAAIMNQWPLDDAIEWIQTKMNPDDVFTEEQLSDWAKDNGFVKED